MYLGINPNLKHGGIAEIVEQAKNDRRDEGGEKNCGQTVGQSSDKFR